MLVLLGDDVSIDGAGDRLVRAARFVLVDERRPLAVVAHPRHQILDPRATGRREGISRVLEIMNMQALGTDRPDCVRPGGHLVEVAAPQRFARGSGKTKRLTGRIGVYAAVAVRLEVVLRSTGCYHPRLGRIQFDIEVRKRNHIRQLEALGYKVILKRAA